MTRTEAIAIITSKLASLDDERVMTVADIVQDMAAPTAVALDLRSDNYLGRSATIILAGRIAREHRL
jgi:hypothetical protein